jgi:nitronate monooxygenase
LSETAATRPSRLDTPLTRQLGIRLPVICGAMYPCSNPELVAAVSEAGGIGVFQPISLVSVHKHEYRAGLRRMRQLTTKPIGMNVIVEKSSKIYEERMKRWVDEALEEGVRFFVTSLGNPEWVVAKAHAVGGIVYHDVTEARFAEKAVSVGVDGLIGVNRRAGGHAGGRALAELYTELARFGLPVVAAGGIGDAPEFVAALELGYAGVQMGTRFIATTECNAHPDYKRAILEADEADIVLTERLTGVPVAVIRTPYIEKIGIKAGPIGRYLLKGRKTKHWMRAFYAWRALGNLARASQEGGAYRDYWQAGKSVATIREIEPVAQILARFEAAAR